MRLLAFSDLHRDRDAAQRLFERTQTEPIDVAIGAGDFATCRNGLMDTLEILRQMPCPLIVVPGNAESDEELRAACAGWDGVHVLHGQQATIGATTFFGLGGGIPVTPFGPWSFDLDESTAAALLESCPDGGVLITHSPPFGLADVSSRGRHLGSRSIREAIEAKRPRLVICGHIHESWGTTEMLGPTTIVNAGPDGICWDLSEEAN